jgi:hypothetical protein
MAYQIFTTTERALFDSRSLVDYARELRQRCKQLVAESRDQRAECFRLSARSERLQRVSWALAAEP